MGIAICRPVLAEDFEFFEKRIRPVLVERCYKCHSKEAEKLKSELFLDSKEGMLKGGESGIPAIIPGNAEKSRLIEAIRYGNADLQMPPPKSGRLTSEQVADFVSWVNAGAPDPRTNIATQVASLADKYEKARGHWAFQPIKTPPVPNIARDGSAPVTANRAPLTPIDHFIIAKLQEKGLRLSPLADKRTLIRRATFDLTGLPPTPEEVDVFMADKSPQAFAAVVDRLLASPRYGERWGRYWLDVARFGDTKG